MNFESIVDLLIQETTRTSLGRFAPELVICVTIIALLFVRLLNADRRLPTYWVSLIGSLIAFVFAFGQFTFLQSDGAQPSGLFGWIFQGLYYLMNLDEGSIHTPASFFTGLLVFDQFTVFFRVFLLLFLILVIALTVLSGIPDTEDGPDFYTLLFGAVIGMMLMVSANHLLILFLGVEMASVPSYVMVGFLKGRRQSSEASLKFVVYGAGTAGVMLYGISLLAGLLGTANFPELAARLSDLLAGQSEVGMSNPNVRAVVLAIMMVLVGLAFKLSVVPFHFWCPDAFEGASAEVAGFLSVASKAAAFALLVRFCMAFVGGETEGLQSVYLSLGIGLGVIAAVTCTFGNLAAYAQTNIKRLLAYSTIAHAGYMLMAVAALLVILNAPFSGGFDADWRNTEARRCVEGLLYYLCVYLFMNLGAFAIVALIRNEIFSEEIKDYDGLAQQAPLLCVCMGICLFSLVGMPPLGGFIGKFMIFASLFEAGNVHTSMWAILVIGSLNTVFSLFYYVRVLRAMFMTDRPERAPIVDLPFKPIGLYVTMITLPILVLGMGGRLFMDGLSQTANSVASVLFR